MRVDRKRNIQLDILRGVAILMVIGAHVHLPAPEGSLRPLVDFWYDHGALGVPLFFVLSGFLVGGLLFSERSQYGRIDVKRFLIRRGFKIYPVYYIFIAYLIAMPTAKAVLAGEDASGVFHSKITDYWPNLVFLHTYFGSNPAGHTWSLANEEHFYIILPILFLAMIRAGRTRAMVIGCLLTIPVFIIVRTVAMQLGDPYAVKMVASHLRLDSLFLGVGIRGVAEYYPDLFAASRRWRYWLLGGGVLLWLPAFYRDDLGHWIYGSVGQASTALGAAAFLLGVYHTRGTDFGRWKAPVYFLASVVAAIGVYSYAIYVWHVTMIRILERAVVAPIAEAFPGSSSVRWLSGMCIVGIGVILGGSAVSRLVEWPVLRVRDRFFPSKNVRVLPDRSGRDST